MGVGQSPGSGPSYAVLNHNQEDHTHTHASTLGSGELAHANAGPRWLDKGRELWIEKREKEKSIPEEQMEGWVRTRQKVIQALRSTLSTAADVAHEGLLLSVDLLEFAPVVGLEAAARTLLQVWDAVQMVDMNRLACLRLTERCAEILISVRDEILETGDKKVSEELESAVVRLVESFAKVRALLVKQAHRPFLKRYLKRDEIQREIAICDRALNDALGMFSLSIQIRILKQVLKAEEQRQADTAAILGRLLEHGGTAASSGTAVNLRGLPPVPSPDTLANALQLVNGPEDDQQPPPQHPLQIINTLQSFQNERDMVRDTIDLRQLMRSALQTNNDMEMIKVLQVGRDEMPEAIKTLQRALETVVEKERAEEDAEAQQALSHAQSLASISVGEEKVKTEISRSNTLSSTSGSSSALSSRRSRASRDTLDREFIESGIESLRRLSLSRGAEISLPSWTITRYEVDREEKIGIGFFSDVYRGRWRDRVVAIKVLAETTPRQLFVHEVSIWKTLKHPNVLELLGASSTTADPPWFFVSPYYKHGSLVRYLKGFEAGMEGVDVLKMIHEIAKGMAYLHTKGILHGDLKGANILVDDRGHCVISDFGQSEMKSEAYRISGTPLPHGTLRWQAPELMAGQSPLTQQVDVYAFAILCVEILTKGGLPWPMADDDAVRHFVLKENMRPEIPLGRAWSLQLKEILTLAWHRIPSNRPSFSKIDEDVQKLRAKYGANTKDSPYSPPLDEDHVNKRKSPPMHPIPLPILPPETTATIVNEPTSSSAETSYETARESSRLSVNTDSAAHHSASSSPIKVTIPSSRASSVFLPTPETDSESGYGDQLDESGYLSPVPADETVRMARDERRYRILLQHEFHPSLSLPLWEPTPVNLGAVGYHKKPEGTFVTLFNSFKPAESSGGRCEGVPSLYGYGRVSQGNQRLDKRNVAQRGMDIIQSWITSKSKGDGTYQQNVSRRYSCPLRNGHKAAHLFTETTNYRYIEDLATPKAWFKANVDHILGLYGAQHGIQKEDLYLVIGTLDAPDYALFVSHHHPDGQVNFNVYSSPKNGQPWGEFTTTSDMSASLLGGPVYDEAAPDYQSATKVSRCKSSGKWDTILVAKLRFPPDRGEPTSL
ncbi:hypothetical protein K474DRAFT_1607894 [Panus rudis PR-1116 ss-1]|nr:hypothetical protein K474DRAFT_1607894 [Panus rudis PR-1116 ss-1]